MTSIYLSRIYTGMENLDSYLKTRGIRQEDFAELIGVKQATVSRLKRGQMRPGLSLAIAIARATNNAVPIDAWVSIPDAPTQTGAAK